MIARLALLLLALAVVASAENLRTEAYDVPIDNARGARVLQRMQQKASAKHTKAAKSIGAKALKKHHDARDAKNALGAEHRSLQGAFDKPWDSVVLTGSLVTRSRPNADCSGPVTEIVVEPAGSCSTVLSSEFSMGPEGGSSESIGTYVSDGGNMLRATGFYENGDCSGEPVQYGPTGDAIKPCQMLADEFGSTGPLMGGTVLTDKTVTQLAKEEKSGFMVANYKNSLCSGDMDSYTLYRNDACHLDIEFNTAEPDLIITMGNPIAVPDELTTDSTFSYVKVTMCEGTTVSITGYTDSACTHKMYRAEVDLSADSDMYTQCAAAASSNECDPLSSPNCICDLGGQNCSDGTLLPRDNRKLVELAAGGDYSHGSCTA
mmetsp:Transcript_27911/g.63189  ORF Transcript_27911/g.63189 Transcript_27911/m.63189 type:complete len:376 (+) Transcript_27911:78-1205(+)